MSTQDTGGYAFPSGNDVRFGELRIPGHAGMTLRDYFAAKAMLIAWNAYHEGYTGQPELVEQSIAHHAYQMADAMLKAREV